MMIEFDEACLSTDETVIVWGAGIQGRQIGRELEARGVNYLYCDKNIVSNIGGIKVIKPSQVGVGDSVIIGSGKYCVDIYMELLRIGVKKIYLGTRMSRSMTSRMKVTGVGEAISRYNYERDILRLIAWMNNGWYIQHLDVVITERCTLKCESCVSLMPKYRNPINYNEKDIKKVLYNLIDSRCYIGEITIMGGEPFCNQNCIVSILDEFRNNPHIGRFWIISNGTMVPDRTFLNEAEKTENLFIQISNYGNSSNKIKEIRDVLSNSSVDFYIEKEKEIGQAWVDYGEVKLYSRSKSDLKREFENCFDGTFCRTILNGHLYICPRIAHGVNLGLIPNQLPSLSVDLLSEYHIREECEKLFKRDIVPYACQYCNKASGRSVQRAKQIAKPVSQEG